MSAVRTWLLSKAKRDLTEAIQNAKEATRARAYDTENVARKQMYTYKGKTKNLYADNLRDSTRWLRKARAEYLLLKRVVRELGGKP